MCIWSKRNITKSLSHEKIGKDDNNEEYSYEIRRSITGHYFVINHYVHRRINPGKDDDYFPEVVYEVFDEDLNLVAKWDTWRSWNTPKDDVLEAIGFDKYPKELGCGLVAYDNNVYALDSLMVLFTLPKKFEIYGIFNPYHLGLCRLKVVGDYRTIYVIVKNNLIVKQFSEDEKAKVMEKLMDMKIEYLKDKGIPVNCGSNEEYKKMLSEIQTYGVRICDRGHMYFSHLICKTKFELNDFLKHSEIDADSMNIIKTLHSYLHTVNMIEPQQYIFNFAKCSGRCIYCCIYESVIQLIFVSYDIFIDINFYNLDGKRITSDEYYIKQDNSGLYKLVKTFNQYEFNVQCKRENASSRYGNDSRYVLLRYDMGMLKPIYDYEERFSNNKVYENMKRLKTMPKEDVIVLSEIRIKNIEPHHYKLHKNVTVIVYKYLYVLVETVEQLETGSILHVWFFDTQGNKLNTEIFVINKQSLWNNIYDVKDYYKTRFRIEREKEKALLVDYDGGTLKVKEDDNSVYYGDNILDCSVKEIVKDYLYRTDPDLGCCYVEPIGRVLINGYDPTLLRPMMVNDPIIVDGKVCYISEDSQIKCREEIFYRKENRPNYITNIKFIKEFETNKGTLSVYEFKCEPTAYFNISGKIYYNFNIEALNLVQGNIDD